MLYSRSVKNRVRSFKTYMLPFKGTRNKQSLLDGFIPIIMRAILLPVAPLVPIFNIFCHTVGRLSNTFAPSAIHFQLIQKLSSDLHQRIWTIL